MQVRPTRLLTEVVEEVRQTLINEHGWTKERFEACRRNADSNGYDYPTGTNFEDITTLWIDYQVQRDVIIKHVIQIMEYYDKQLHGTASGCVVDGEEQRKLYDGQQRTVAAGLLGYTKVPCTMVYTKDASFPSYAFEMLNDKSVAKLTSGDLHRNKLVRYSLGNREPKIVMAYKMQQQFDKAGVDLTDKNSRKRMSEDEKACWFFSHFNYAEKGIEADKSGKVLFNVLNAITTNYPEDEEINQDLFIGLLELNRLDEFDLLPDNWMDELLQTIKKVYPRSTMFETTGKTSSLFKKQCQIQVAHVSPGKGWSAPYMMSNFLREVFMIKGGNFELPTHGAGAELNIKSNPAPELML